VLILEIAHADTVQKDEHGEVKQSPIYRNIKEAVPVIYHSQNWQNIFQALLLSLLYYFAHYWITAFLERFIFRHTVLRPFAYAASSVLLCDIHFLKTGTAISARCPLSPLMTTEDPDRFSQLAGPAFALGMSKALMNRVESVIKYLILSRKGESPNSMGMRAGTDVLIVMVVIVFRVAGILPGTIIMTLTEVSLLPPGLETIIPSRTKCRGVLISEVLGGSKITPGFAGFVDIMKPFRVPQLTLLIGLHLQKCHLQVMIELISSFLILAMIL
jgi:hypothetical protein